MPKRASAPAADLEERPAMESLPLTGYATLGLLSPNEWFTAVDIQERAYWELRAFYWAPALSHIRRELNRLEDLGYVDAEVVQQGRVKRTLKYRITDLGAQALTQWVERPEPDPFIVKNAVILRLWLGRRADNPHLVLAALERHIEHVEGELAALEEQMQQSEQRLQERIQATEGVRHLKGSDLHTLVTRSSWHRGVMQYCRRGYENELRNSAELLKELTRLVDDDR